MELNLISMISTLGFPIVAYLLVYLDLRKVILELKESMNTNTKVIAKLCEKIGIDLE